MFFWKLGNISNKCTTASYKHFVNYKWQIFCLLILFFVYNESTLCQYIIFVSGLGLWWVSISCEILEHLFYHWEKRKNFLDKTYIWLRKNITGNNDYFFIEEILLGIIKQYNYSESLNILILVIKCYISLQLPEHNLFLTSQTFHVNLKKYTWRRNFWPT